MNTNSGGVGRALKLRVRHAPRRQSLASAFADSNVRLAVETTMYPLFNSATASVLPTLPASNDPYSGPSRKHGWNIPCSVVCLSTMRLAARSCIEGMSSSPVAHRDASDNCPAHAHQPRLLPSRSISAFALLPCLWRRRISCPRPASCGPGGPKVPSRHALSTRACSPLPSSGSRWWRPRRW